MLIRESNRLLTPSFDSTDFLGVETASASEITTILEIIDLGKRFDVPRSLPKAFYNLAKLDYNLEEAELLASSVHESETGWVLQGLGKDDGSCDFLPLSLSRRVRGRDLTLCLCFSS